MLKGRFLSFLIFCVFSASVQQLFFDVKAGPQASFSLGRANQQFWHFVQDSSTAYKNIKVHKYPLVGASVSSGVRLIYNEKRRVQFTLETNLDYVYKTYAIDWSSAYVNINGQGNFDAAYKIKQHELGLSALPGLLFKNLNFNAGLRLKFVVTATEAGRFYKDDTAFYTRLKTGAGNTSPIALLSMPLYLAYSVPVSKKTALGFFVQYELGLCDFNDFEVNWNRQETIFVSGLSFGLNVKFLLRNIG